MDKLGRSDLHYASNQGEVNKVKTLVVEGADVNLKDKQGWTSLHFAAQAQSAEIVQLLIDAGAIIDARDSNGNTPLFRAVFNYRTDGSTIELLRKYGADPYSQNNFEQTPLGLARLIANYDVKNFFADLPL